jgi:hypothetical protein
MKASYGQQGTIPETAISGGIPRYSWAFFTYHNGITSDA